MARKRYTTEQIIRKLREAEVRIILCRTLHNHGVNNLGL